MVRPFKLILMGTGPFAVPGFDAIWTRSPEWIDLVITKPGSASQGKGKPPINPVWEWAKSRNLPIEQPLSINDPTTCRMLEGRQADLFVVCDYGQILSREALTASRLGGVNLHGSLLPRHRGAAPVQWAILSGDDVSGVTVIHMTPRLDGGPILSRASSTLLPSENAAELEHRLSELGVVPLLESLQYLAKWEPPTTESSGNDIELGEKQDAAMATKAPRLQKGHGQLDFRQPALKIDRQVRGLSPWPGTFAELSLGEGKSMRVSVVKGYGFQQESLPGTEVEVGTMVWGAKLAAWPASPQNLELVVRASDGWFAIELIQPAGKRVLTAKEFLMGYQRNPVMQFALPAEPNPLYAMMS